MVLGAVFNFKVKRTKSAKVGRMLAACIQQAFSARKIHLPCRCG